MPRLMAAWSRLCAEVACWRRVMAHPRTPRRTRWLVGAALAYLASPVDLVPDFIPLLGHLDDVVVVGGLLLLARRAVPPEVWEECRRPEACPQASEGE